MRFFRDLDLIAEVLNEYEADAEIFQREVEEMRQDMARLHARLLQQEAEWLPIEVMKFRDIVRMYRVGHNYGNKLRPDTFALFSKRIAYLPFLWCYYDRSQCFLSFDTKNVAFSLEDHHKTPLFFLALRATVDDSPFPRFWHV